MNINTLKSEITYKAVRSSGSGGQHVNKVASKVELYFNIETSQVFNVEEKQKLTKFLNTRLTKNGVLILSCDESRSQFRNKAIVTQRFFNLLEEGLKEQKKRLPTKISRTAIRKRLNNKRKHSEKKTNRKKPEL